jgi:GMP synthase (glutamine-hydrolysing)
MAQALAIRHVPFEHLGTLAPLLADRGVDMTYLEAGIDRLDPPETPDLLVVLGGPIGAYQEAEYPFIADELALIRRQLEAGKPLIGICLGAQLIARALGARVYPGRAKEIGWSPLLPTDQACESCLAPLAQNDWQVLHWHGDVFELPAGAVPLASTPLTANQAFTLGDTVLALQFHIEAVTSEIEHWLIGHTVELAQAGIDLSQLRKDTARWGPGLEAAGRQAFETWMAGAFGERGQTGEPAS